MERWSPSGELIGTGTTQGSITVRRAVSGSMLWTCPEHLAHRGAVNVLAWSPDEMFIASGSNDSTIKIWNARDGSLVYIYTEHTGPVLGLDWSPVGPYIVSVGGDSPQIWEVPVDEVEGALPHH